MPSGLARHFLLQHSTALRQFRFIEHPGRMPERPSLPRSTRRACAAAYKTLIFIYQGMPVVLHHAHPVHPDAVHTPAASRAPDQLLQDVQQRTPLRPVRIVQDEVRLLSPAQRLSRSRISCSCSALAPLTKRAMSSAWPAGKIFVSWRASLNIPAARAIFCIRSEP